jgi:hypothetical protein
MAEVVSGFTQGILEIYDSFLSVLPPGAQNIINLFLPVFLVVVYAVFIWKFYRFISTKNILGLNLNKYNKTKHPFFEKILAGLLYFVEYILILPFLIFFWFSVFTIFLIFLTENLDVSTLLIVAATIIAAIRVTCYIPKYGQNLSGELAKLLPFTLLAVSLLGSNFFDMARIINHLKELPGFFQQIIYYLTFIVGFEILLRFFDFVISLFALEETPTDNEEITEEENTTENEEETNTTKK